MHMVSRKRSAASASERELRALLIVVALFFVGFLAFPMDLVVIRAFTGGDGGVTFAGVSRVFARPEFMQNILNSLAVSVAAAASRLCWRCCCPLR